MHRMHFTLSPPPPLPPSLPSLPPFPSLSHRALMCLNDLGVANLMTDLTRNNLFPSSEEVAALSLQFALPTMDGEAPPRIPDQGPREDHTSLRPMTPYLMPRTKRVWLYLDANNPRYEELLRQRRSMLAEGNIQNFIRSNIVSLSMKSCRPQGTESGGDSLAE